MTTVNRAWILAAVLAGACTAGESGTTLAPVSPATARAAGTVTAESIERVPPSEARGRVLDGRALLVCVYGDEKCAGEAKLQGSIPFSELEALLPTLPKDREIILYCG